MGELWFIGVGLGDERDLSRRALDVLRSCPRVFAEEYTAALSPGSLDRLAEELGRPIRRLERAELEGERPVLDALALGSASPSSYRATRSRRRPTSRPRPQTL